MPWRAQDDEAVVKRIADNYNELGAWYNRQQLQDGKCVFSADELRATLGLDPRKKTAVIFSHILYDATFFYGDNLFDDYEDWLVETVRGAIANPALNWVVKVHPVNVWRSRMDGAALVQLEAEALHKRFGELPAHVKLMPADTAVNTFSLFKVIDFGLTVRGTIGMELPCFGIPVVTAGTGRDAARGFTIDPTSRDEYANLLETLPDIAGSDAEQIRRAPDPPDPRKSHSFIMHGHALFPLPEGFSGMVPMDSAALAASPLLSEAGKKRVRENGDLPAGTGKDDESVASFMIRRWGEEAFQLLVEPLVGGIHAGDARLLSREAIVPPPRRTTEPGAGTGPPFLTFTKGTTELVRALERRLTGITILRGAAAESITRRGRGYMIEVPGGEEREADALIIATPAHEAARLLAPLDPACGKCSA